jgi:carboxymethylenebutenolidase
MTKALAPTLTNIQVTPELGGLLAVPQGTGPWPAVVMVHEVFGIDDNMKAQATRLSQAGYVVLMPDLYSRGGMRKCLTSTFKALAAGKGQAFDDVASAKPNPADAKDAWLRIEKFFTEHLRS